LFGYSAYKFRHPAVPGFAMKTMILCIDDDAVGLRIRKLLLETRGYQVLTAENGAEGIRAFASSDIDLVILDYVMPEMDGGVVATEMRRLKPGIPILLLSAYVDLPPAVLASVNACAVKGESPNELLSSVAQLLSATRSATASATME
jgi:CheY-like chemotaxis protein